MLLFLIFIFILVVIIVFFFLVMSVGGTLIVLVAAATASMAAMVLLVVALLRALNSVLGFLLPLLLVLLLVLLLLLLSKKIDFPALSKIMASRPVNLAVRSSIMIHCSHLLAFILCIGLLASAFLREHSLWLPLAVPMLAGTCGGANFFVVVSSSLFGDTPPFLYPGTLVCELEELRDRVHSASVELLMHLGITNICME